MSLAVNYVPCVRWGLLLSFGRVALMYMLMHIRRNANTSNSIILLCRVLFYLYSAGNE